MSKKLEQLIGNMTASLGAKLDYLADCQRSKDKQEMFAAVNAEPPRPTTKETLQRLIAARVAIEAIKDIGDKQMCQACEAVMREIFTRVGVIDIVGK